MEKVIAHLCKLHLTRGVFSADPVNKDVRIRLAAVDERPSSTQPHRGSPAYESCSALHLHPVNRLEVVRSRMTGLAVLRKRELPRNPLASGAVQYSKKSLRQNIARGASDKLLYRRRRS